MKFRLLAALALAMAAGAGASYADVCAILSARCVVCHQGEARGASPVPAGARVRFRGAEKVRGVVQADGNISITRVRGRR